MRDYPVKAELFDGDEEKIAEYRKQVGDRGGNILVAIGGLVLFTALFAAPVLLVVLVKLGKITIPFIQMVP